MPHDDAIIFGDPIGPLRSGAAAQNQSAGLAMLARRLIF